MKSTVLHTLAEVEEYFQYRDFRVTSCDTETNGLDYYTMEMYGISFCNGTDAVYIDLINNPDRGLIIEFLRELFKKIEFIVFHNAPFDLKVLYKEGIHNE